MKNNNLLSIKIQLGLAFAPIIGIFVVLFTSIINLGKIKRSAPFIWFLMSVIPVIIIALIAGVIWKNLATISNEIIQVILCVIVTYVVCILIALVWIGIEKILLKMTNKPEYRKQDNNEIK